MKVIASELVYSASNTDDKEEYMLYEYKDGQNILKIVKYYQVYKDMWRRK